MFPTSIFWLTFFDRAVRAQCSVKKSQSKCGSREHLKILPYNNMTLKGLIFNFGTVKHYWYHFNYILSYFVLVLFLSLGRFGALWFTGACKIAWVFLYRASSKSDRICSGSPKHASSGRELENPIIPRALPLSILLFGILFWLSFLYSQFQLGYSAFCNFLDGLPGTTAP